MDTTVMLTAEEAELFMRFREHQTEFKQLLEAGLFGIKSGSAEIHFDIDGALASIDMHFRVFRRVRGVVVIQKPVDKVGSNESLSTTPVDKVAS